ncbi:hypothetical protein CO173_02275 [Candidatus Uhrbacteria bacterium CG_4_9_14_3_um_filter_41_35]|uniref:Glycosyltransferase 2-like domain-containing protein n=1 Tax=Candidatus Uhrbacteria bacterium CG_4_9_14_3_um_filter_41_35 TaxID=1975034 RepID=A0A2M7XFD8_9BACT|nr:MAG: hypothetical protein COV92_01120 [Candidatus Uhrbacteria bacterium CG11_big_fil_rev_8_21_14_0_20_41_9]PJA46571.1 MAG: hypothetical protein CO173_02275 [Candidatus Uhrbacteria bacterium CG_4_9_14_3_um_filter_41_35]
MIENEIKPILDSEVPDVSIVIVTYKEELELLKQCFDSVEMSVDIKYEMIVVDNAGREDTEALVKQYSYAKYIKNSANLGFAAAVNLGMKRGLARYMLLLNPDTKFGESVLAQMAEKLDHNPEVGVGSCLIKYPGGEIQDSIRRFPKLLDQTLVMLKVPHFLKTKAVDKYMMRDADPLETQDVDSIMGAFMWIRRELINDIGYFDERYFIWFEEVDYCKMAHDAGWKIRHYSDTEITHIKGHMFEQIPTLKKQKWMRESLRKYVKKHVGIPAWLFLWILSPVFIGLGHLVALIKK